MADELIVKAPTVKPKVIIQVSGEEALARADREIEHLKAVLKDTNAELDRSISRAQGLEYELSEVNEKYDRLAYGTGFKEQEDQLKQFKHTAELAVDELKAFLTTVNLIDSEGFGDYQFKEYFKRIREGSITAGQAIFQIKTNMRELMEENYNNSDGLFDSQMVQEFSATLSRLEDTLSSVVERIINIEENGVKSIGGSGGGEITNVFEQIEEAALSMTNEIGDSYKSITDLVSAMNEFANIDRDRLVGISNTFYNIASMGKGSYGTKTIENIVRLTRELQSLSKESAAIRFDFTGLNELKVSKASLNNLATFLPQLAGVNSDKLKKLSEVDLTNFNNIKVSKGTVEDIVKLAEAFNSVKPISASKRGKITEDPTKDKEAEDRKRAAEKKAYDLNNESLKEYVRLLKDVDKISMKSSSTKFDGKKWKTENNEYSDRISRVNELAKSVDRLGIKIRQVDGKFTLDLSGNSKDQANKLGMSVEQYNNLVDTARKKVIELNESHDKSSRSISSTWEKTKIKVSEYLAREEDIIKKNPEVARTIQEIRALLSQGGSEDDLDKLTELYNKLTAAVAKSSANVKTWGDKMKATFGSKLRTAIAGLGIGNVTMQLRQMYTNVVEIDGALTQLQIVTGATDDKMREFLTSSIKLSKELGASVKDTLGTIETFSRLGYNLEDSSTLARYTSILANVAGVDAGSATTGLTSIIKGFNLNVSESEHIADVLIQVGQKYAISAGELMEAFSRSGAALGSTGMSFEKSAAILAAANAAVQDSSTVGTALKTISARIRGSKTELSELGEDVEELSEGFSKYAVELKSLTGFNIMVEGSTTEFKDLYDIMLGVSQAWGDLSDTSRARVAEILGGTRQFQVISSILSNMSDATGAYSDALNSAGVAEAANELFTSSINGKIKQLKASFEELSVTVVNSELIKFVVSSLDSIVTGLNKLLSIGDGAAVKFAMFAASLIAANAGVTKIHSVIVKTTLQFSKYAKEIEKAGSFTKWFAGSSVATAATVVGIAAACTILISVLSSLDKKWKEAYDNAKSSADSFNETADGYKAEADALEDLQDRLTEARGNKQALASIYNDLNKKVAVSIDLVNGEEDAYNRANKELERQIEYNRILEKQNREKAITSNREAFNRNQVVRKGIFGVDALAADMDGSIVRNLVRDDDDASDRNGAYRFFDPNNMRSLGVVAEHGGDDAVSHLLNYDLIQGMSEEDQKYVFGLLGIDKLDWDTYWKEQIDTAKNVFQDTIESSDGLFGRSFMNSYVEDLVVHGNTLDEIYSKISKLGGYELDLDRLINSYHGAMSNGDFSGAIRIYNDINAYIDDMISKFPEAAAALNALRESISGVAYETQTGLVVALKKASDILEETQGTYDSLVGALKDMSENGRLSAGSIKDLYGVEVELNKVGLVLYDEMDTENSLLRRTQEGYILCEDALNKYVEAKIREYTIEKAFATAQDRENAIANLKSLRAVLLTLAASYDNVESATDSHKNALNDAKDKLKEQLDAYKALIDYRKKLLSTYEKELSYQRELNKKQSNVASLSARLSVAQLDNSAAGRARARSLSSELREAQEDLEDFTLEHAIEVITNDLDDQYAEYEKYINGKINGIENAIKNLQESEKDNSDAIVGAVDSILPKIDEAIEATQNNSVINVITSDIGEMTSSGYTYSNYLSSLRNIDEKWADGVRTVNPNGWNDDTDFVQRRLSLPKDVKVLSEAEWNRLKNKRDAILTGMGIPTYHTGGVVGDLASNEEFAKLMNGEFVSTPAMMDRFMKQTLPQMMSSAVSGRVEVNSPLVQVNCDNVTSEALPRLKEIVNEAVKEVKKELDEGFSRTGFKKKITT